MASPFASGNILRLLIIIATVIAIILQWVTQYRCDFALYENDESAGIGVWFLMNNDECNSEVFDPDESDPYITAARSCLTIAMICAAIGAILVAFEWCCCDICCAACLEMSAFFSALVFAALVNLVYGSELCTDEEYASVNFEGIEVAVTGDTQCKVGPATTMNIIATILYFGCCVFLCCAGAPEPILRRNRNH
eukprot:scaffold2299_cov131-Cylindrotheca_fusiformis.AAC.8